MAEDLEHPPYDPSYDPAGEVVDICRDLIRMDTSNFGDDSGPGERKAAEHVAALLDEVGIEAQLYESEPGRTSVVAQWGQHPGGENALLLHGHLDVVPAVAEDWQVDPFSGEIRDGYLWGRGAVDMKDFDAMLLSVVRARTRDGAVPERPIVLCFTADEEAGGHHGAQVLVEDHRVSGKHVWIGLDQGRLVAVDHGTTNGTYINDIARGRISRAELRDGDVVIVGEPDCCSLQVRLA